MERLPSPSQSGVELVGVAGVFVILLAYTYALFFQLPYLGFEWDVGQGVVTEVWGQSTPGLAVGDKLINFNGISLEQYRRDLGLEFFPNDSSATAIPLEIERNGVSQTLTWQGLGFTQAELWARLQSQWFIAWAFWFTGALSFLVLRPPDDRWRLFILFHLLTALWLSASTLARWHFGWSAFVLRSAVWASVPVYWHLHWVYPQRLPALPRWVTVLVYSLAGGLAVAEWFNVLPPTLYVLGLGGAILGALGLLLWRLRTPAQRASVRPLLLAMVAAFGPTLVLVILTANGQATITSAAGLLALPALPAFYFYAAYRRQLGPLELRANRLLAAYLFFLALVTGVGLVASLINLQSLSANDASLVWLVTLLSVAGLAIFAFPRFEHFVERRLLGVKIPPDEVLASFSTQLSLSPNAAHLGQLLEQTLMPAWLIRQSSLLRLQTPEQITVVYAQGLPLQWADASVKAPNVSAAEYLEQASTWPWVRVALPLKVQEQWVGLWLLGRRDPDDFYTQRDRAALHVLANQMAVAFAHFGQTERLRQLYEVNVDRHEAERKQLALHLHDEILNNLAVLKTTSPATVDEALYQHIVQQVRYLISDLRPVMLTYGLRRALEQLAEDLAERAGPTLTIQANLGAVDQRYPVTVEQHLFRIVQQATENAWKHAQASQILVTGHLTPERIQLCVADDGIGLPARFATDLRQLLEQRHFGLAGMVERADLAGAKLTFTSAPAQGTKVEAHWPASR